MNGLMTNPFYGKTTIQSMLKNDGQYGYELTWSINNHQQMYFQWLTWKFPKMRVPRNHPQLDHDSLLKPMVTWGSLILGNPGHMMYLIDRYQLYTVNHVPLCIMMSYISIWHTIYTTAFLLLKPYQCQSARYPEKHDKFLAGERR